MEAFTGGGDATQTSKREWQATFTHSVSDATEPIASVWLAASPWPLAYRFGHEPTAPTRRPSHRPSGVPPDSANAVESPRAWRTSDTRGAAFLARGCGSRALRRADENSGAD